MCKQPQQGLVVARSHHRFIYIIVGIIMMLFLGTVYAYSVFRVALENKLGIGSAESGMPYMVALAFYAIFMFFTGKFIERFHPRILLITGGLLVALGWISSAFTTDILMLTLTYGCVSGSGVGIAYGVPLSVVAKWFPDMKGLAVGLVLVGFGISPLVTAPLVSALVVHYGVMETFLVLGVSFAVLLPILALTFKNPSRDVLSGHDENSMNSLSPLNLSLPKMVRTASFKGVYLNFIIGSMIGLMMIGMTTNVGVDYFQLDAGTVTKAMPLFAVFNGLGRPTFGWFTDRYSTKSAMLLSYFLMLFSAVVVIVSDTHMFIYLFAFSVFWFNLGGWLAIAPTSTLKLYGMKNYSQNYGLVFTAYGIGAIVGVSTSGMLLDFHGHYHTVFYYIIGLCLCGALLTAKLIKR